MSFQPGANLYTQGFGSRAENVEVPHLDVRAPTTTDVLYPIGKRWIDTVAGNEYTLMNFTSVGGVLSANWGFLGSSSGDLNTLTTDNLAIVSPTAGTILLNGTANQITTTGTNAPGKVVLSIPSAFIAPGSIASTTTLTGGTGITATTGNISATAGAVNAGTSMTATLGNITATNGNLVLGTAGNKIVSTSVATTTTAGANSFGTVTLVGGTATVNTSAVTTNSIVMLTRQTVGSTGANPLGVLSRGAIVNGVSFVINAWSSTDATALAATDVSNIGWMIIN